MKCPIFERRVADWLGGRLAPEPARQMAVHRAACPACARVAQAEEQLRALWREGVTSRQVPDLWPRLALRLPAREQPKASAYRRSAPRWVMSGVALAALVLGLRLGTVSGPFGDHPVTQGAISSVPHNGLARQSRTVLLSGLGDVAQTNPAVDDPAGTNIENVWIQLKTNSSARTTDGDAAP